jgi:hypothetical protein
MDNASVAVEVTRFDGLNFGQACALLFAECKSSAPEVDGFQNLITYVKSMHETLGLEFKVEEYWNPETVSGTYPVWPDAIARWQPSEAIAGPVTRESTQALLKILRDTTRLADTYRRGIDAVSQNSQRRGREGLIDPNMLVRAVNTAPLFVPEASEDDEDDFL